MAQVYDGASTDVVSSTWDSDGQSQVTVIFQSGTGTVTMDCASRDAPTEFVDSGDTDLTFTASGVMLFTWDGPVRLSIASASGLDLDAYLEDVRDN